MILDKIENLHLYAGVNPYINKVVEFIGTTNLDEMPQGRVELCGADCFANFDVAHGKNKEQALLETHDKMIDIQLILDNTELIGWRHRSTMPEVDYSPENDISFYPSEHPHQYITLCPDYFLIFFPDDAHAPCISDKEIYRKVIFKLAI